VCLIPICKEIDTNEMESWKEIAEILPLYYNDAVDHGGRLQSINMTYFITDDCDKFTDFL
jgi:hypothetical protein